MKLYRAWFGAGMLALHVAALAGVADTIHTTLAEVQSPVSYGGVAAFDVTVTNQGGNVANAVSFSGTASVGSFRSVEGTTACTGGGASVTCSFGQMRPGDTFSFTVLFNAPPPPSDPPADASLVLNTQTRYSEGGNGPKSKPINSLLELSDSVTLQSPTGTQVASVVPGGAFFTIGTVPGDGFSTAVTVPPQAARTTSTIVEAPFEENCTNFETCYSSTVAIPVTFNAPPYLKIVLHQDASNIKPGTQIGSVVIFYTPDNSTDQYAVGLCATPTTPTGTGIPCIAKATHYKSRSVDGWTPELDGDMVWELLNTVNGSYRLP